MKKVILLFAYCLVGCDLGSPTFSSGNANYFPIATGKVWKYNYELFEESTLELKLRTGILSWKVLSEQVQSEAKTYQLEESLEATEQLIRKDGVGGVLQDSMITWSRKIEMRVEKGKLSMRFGDDQFGDYNVLLTETAPLQVKYGTVYIPSGEMTFERNQGLVSWKMFLDDRFRMSRMQATLMR